MSDLHEKMSELFVKPRLLCDPEWYSAAGSGEVFRILEADSLIRSGVYVTERMVYDVKVNPSDNEYRGRVRAPLEIVCTWNTKLNNVVDPFPNVRALYMPDVSPRAIGCLWKIEPPCSVPSNVDTHIFWFSKKSATGPWEDPLSIEDAQKDWEDGQVVVGFYVRGGDDSYNDFAYGMFKRLFPVSVNAYYIDNVLQNLLGRIDELYPDWEDVMYIDKFKHVTGSHKDEKFVETSCSVLTELYTQDEAHLAIEELMSAAYFAGDYVSSLFHEYKLEGIVKWM